MEKVVNDNLTTSYVTESDIEEVVYWNKDIPASRKENFICQVYSFMVGVDAER